MLTQCWGCNGQLFSQTGVKKKKKQAESSPQSETWTAGKWSSSSCPPVWSSVTEEMTAPESDWVSGWKIWLQWFHFTPPPIPLPPMALFNHSPNCQIIMLIPGRTPPGGCEFSSVSGGDFAFSALIWTTLFPAAVCRTLWATRTCREAATEETHLESLLLLTHTHIDIMIHTWPSAHLLGQRSRRSQGQIQTHKSPISLDNPQDRRILSLKCPEKKLKIYFTNVYFRNFLKALLVKPDDKKHWHVLQLFVCCISTVWDQRSVWNKKNIKQKKKIKWTKCTVRNISEIYHRGQKKQKTIINKKETVLNDMFL